MSRHTIPNAPGSPATCETAVGWDPGMNTFFATCFDSAKGEDESEVFWLGGSPCEIPGIGNLARALAKHGVELPLGIARKLGEDYQREGKRFAGRPATNLIAAMSVTYAGPEQAERISAALTGRDLKDGVR